MSEGVKQEFVGEAMVPAKATSDTAAMSRGEPGLPERFTWRQAQYRIAGVLERWKTSGPCKSGAAEMYLRRHWYRVLVEPADREGDRRRILTIYCERQARSSKRPKARWWIYTAEDA